MKRRSSKQSANHGRRSRCRARPGS
jgi:hypothetical protein